MNIPDDSTQYASAADWPAWTDEVAYWPTDAEAPSEADGTAHAAMNTDWHYDGPTPLDALGRDRG